MANQELSPEQQMQACVAHCTRCHGICLKTASHCLESAPDGGEVVTMLQVCADICRVSADAMLRGSQLHRIICRACAEVCAKSADACEGLDADAQLKECAAACLICSDSCAAMANAAA